MQILNVEQLLSEKASHAMSMVETLNAELATVTPFVKKGVEPPAFVTNELNRLTAEISKAKTFTVSIKGTVNEDGSTTYEIVDQTIVKRSGVTTNGSNTVSINGQTFTSAFDAVDYIFPVIGLKPREKKDYDAQSKLFGLALQGKFSYSRGNGIVVDAGILVSGEDLLTEPMKAVYAAWLKSGGVAKV